MMKNNTEFARVRCSTMLAGLAVTMLAGAARAQDNSTSQTNVTSVSGSSLSGAGPVATVPAVSPQITAGTAAVKPCAAYNYEFRTEIIGTPVQYCETLFPSLFGLRKVLGDNGWGFIVFEQPAYSYDLNGNNTRPQNYTGQDPTYTQQLTVDITYDLNQLHILPGDSQLAIQGTYGSANYPTGGVPNQLSMTTLAIDERLADDHVELLYGYLVLIREFYGAILGGNSAAAALGPVSLIPVQAGLSFFEPTPTFEVILRSPAKKFYNNFAVSRSVSPVPGGIFTDITENPSGFNLNVPNARAIVADEFGYRVSATATQNAAWVRAGYIYNSSHFPKWNGGFSSNNWAAYVAGTVQVLRHGSGPQGLYMDAKADLAPGSQNLYVGDYQATLFDIGLFPNRPADMIALGYSKDYFSHDAQLLERAHGVRTSSHSTATSLSYALRVHSGLYLVTGITYQRSPAFAPQSADAVLLQEGLNFAF